MQPLMQHIFKQIINFLFVYGSVISFQKLALGIKTIFFFVNLVFGQKFRRNAQNYLDMLFLIFCHFNTQPLWILIQGWKEGQKIISNLVPIQMQNRLFFTFYTCRDVSTRATAVTEVAPKF